MSQNQASISPSTSNAFHKHLSFFTSAHQPNTVTLLSSLRSSLSIGLNFPASILFCLGLRYLYSPSRFFFLPLKPPNLQNLKPNQKRTMLLPEEASQSQSQSQTRSRSRSSDADAEADDNNNNRFLSSYSRGDMLAMIPGDQNTWTNRLHVWGLWALAADNNTGKVSRSDMRDLQRGVLMETLRKRRQDSRASEVVLPFRRGGPGNVAGHSWAVWKVFGVKVYRTKRD